MKYIDFVEEEKDIQKLFLLISLKGCIRNYIGFIGFLFCVYLYVFED